MSLDDYPAWPAYALDPPPLNDSYALQFPDNVIRTDMDYGARQRKVYRNGLSTFFPTWPMTPTEFQFFKGWHARFGGDWFTIPVFDGDPEGDDGSGYTTRVVRFVKGPLKPTRDGGEWMTAAQIETLDNIFPSETDTAIMALTWNTTMSPSDIAGIFHTSVALLQGDLPFVLVGS